MDRQDQIAWWGFDEGRGHLAQDSISGLSDEIHYVFIHARNRAPADPIWAEGISGKALLFDGYSTWIERAAASAPVPGQALSVSVWAAPRAFEYGDDKRLSAIVNQHHREKRQGYIFGVYRHGAWSFQVGAGGEWYEVWSEDHLLPANAWSFLTAVFDGANGCLVLYLNGKEAARRSILPGTYIRPCPTAPLCIGKNNQAVQLGKEFTVAAQGKRAFEANFFNGLLDDLRLYNRALSAEEIEEQYRNDLSGWGFRAPAPDTSFHRERFAGDPHRPQYHFIPPEHWQNEAHGLLHYHDQYHVFYQMNPHGPFWHQIHWGHAVSPDLVHWRDLPIALAPERHAVDPDGCWSGCAIIDDDGVPRIFYAAGDDSHIPNQSVAMATSTILVDKDEDLKRWIKFPQLLAEQQPGIGRFGEFRDPFVWKDQEIWYMLVGSGITGQGGTALLYSSTDLETWNYHHPFFEGNLQRYPKTGEVWELPGLMPLGKNAGGQEKYLFVVNPWYQHPNPYYCKYVFSWIGTFDRKRLRFIPDQEAPNVINTGEHWIGPAYLVDQNGRCIITALAHQSPIPPGWAYERGWWHHLALPEWVYLREDGRLGVEPIPELANLRTAELLSVADADIEEVNRALQSARGSRLEILVAFDGASTAPFGVDVRVSPQGEEYTRVFFHPEQGMFGADTTHSSLDPEAPKGVEGDMLNLQGESLTLRIFVDQSVIEAFANGLKSLTTITYPTHPDALGIRLFGEMIKVKRLQVWTLESIYKEDTSR